MRRGCLIGLIGVIGLCLGGWVLLWYAGLPAVRGEVRADLVEGVGTEIARNLPAASAVGIAPGSYVITAADLEQALGANFTGGGSVQGLSIDISPAGVSLGITAEGGQAATYTGVPATADGRLILRDMRSDNEVLEFFLPAQELGQAIADGVNQALAADRLILEGVELSDGRIELRTAPLG